MSTVHATPARAHALPKYPTRPEVLADPELLRQRMPAEWVKLGEKAALAGFLLAAGTSGCSGRDSTATPPGTPTPATLAQAAIVAPIFEHGDGRGVAGCVVVSPPVFLSEEEAVQVIREELLKAGLDMTESGVEIKDVQLPLRRYEQVTDWVRQTISMEWVEVPSGSPLVADLKDPDRRVAVTFVSGEDASALGTNDDENGTTAFHFDVKAAAERVADYTRRDAKNVHLGIFYDPLPTTDWMDSEDERYAEAQKRLRDLGRAASEYRATDTTTQQAERRDRIYEVYAEEPKRLLREQVRDFVEWLKGQGVI